MKKTLLLLAGTIFGLLHLGLAQAQEQQVSSPDFLVNIDSQYIIYQDGLAEVKQILSIKNVASTTPDVISVETVGDQPSNLSTSFQDSIAISAEVNNDVIDFAINGQLSGYTAEWSLSADYNSNMVHELNDTKYVFLPKTKISSNNSANFEVVNRSYSVSLPESFGAPNIIGEKQTSSTSALGQQIYSFSGESAKDIDGSIIAFGQQQKAEVNINGSTSSSFWWSSERVVLPADTVGQVLSVKNSSAIPSQAMLDKDGNVVYEFSAGPFSTNDWSMQAEAILSSTSINIDETAQYSEEDQPTVDLFTGNNGVWASFDSSNKQEGGFVSDTIRKVLDGSASSFDGNSYDSVGPIASSLRQSGVPTRMVKGQAFTDGKTIYDEPRQAYWLEVYMPGGNWAQLDPEVYYNLGHFGANDLLHVAHAVLGVESSDQVFDSTELSTKLVDASDVSIDEVSQSEAIVEGKKHVLIPFVFSLDKAWATAPVGVISDDNALRIGGESGPVNNLGSMVPLQTSSVRSISVGPSTLDSGQIDYGTVSGGVFSSTQESEYSIAYWPFIGLLATVGLLGFVVYRLRNRGPRSRTNKSNNTKVQIPEAAPTAQAQNRMTPASRMDQPPAPTIKPTVKPKVQRSSSAKKNSVDGML